MNITELVQSLKAAAEKATPGGWCIDDYHGVIADAGLNGNYYIASCSGPDHRSNKRFIALANPANVLALVEALEKAQTKNELVTGGIAVAEKLRERIAYLEKRLRGTEESLIASTDMVAELESRTVKLPPKVDSSNVPFAGHSWNCCLEEVEKRLTAAGIKVAEDSVEPDVSDGNQPGLVVAVHIDAGDFVKFRGQVYEVKETDFDDHDVTLWFVCGEALKCAAGCQIEVVSAPGETE